jgi:hypothetical protein
LFELNLIDSFNLSNCELCRRVGLSDEQTSVMMNIFFEVLSNGNKSYGDGAGKTKERDWQLLKVRLQ